MQHNLTINISVTYVILLVLRLLLPMAKNNFSISLPQSKIEQVLQMAAPGETPGLTIKRLLLEVLGDKSGNGEDSPAPDPEKMDYLNHRLDRLEEIVQLGNPAGPGRLDKLEERLAVLESRVKSLALQFSERVYELSQAQVVDLSPLESRLAEIERRLDSTPATPAAAVPTPTRLPKATKRKTQETPNSRETL